MNNILLKNYRATAPVAPYRIVKFGAVADGTVTQCELAADASIGISGRVAADQAGQRLDIVRVGLAEVEYGEGITRGQLLTADTQGRAIAATPGARVIGVAEASGNTGDIGSALIAPSTIPA